MIPKPFLPITSSISFPTPDLYTLYGYSCLGVIGICLLVRMAYGASPFFLFRTRFYEIPPIRLIFHFLFWCNWAGIGVCFCVFLRYCLGWVESHQDSYGRVIGIAATYALIGYFPIRLLLEWLIRIPQNAPPTVSIQGVETSAGIDRGRLSSIGKEEFPQMLVYGHTSGLGARVILAILGLATMALVIACSTDWGQTSGIREACIGLIRQLRREMPTLAVPIAMFFSVSGFLGLSLILLSNANYNLIRFPVSIMVSLFLGVLCLVAMASLGIRDQSLGIFVGLTGTGFAIRYFWDLKRALRFQKQRAITAPIAQSIQAEFPYLETLKKRPDFSLKELDEKEIRTRITKGCRNVEEKSFLVTRNLARFLSLVRIEYEQFSAAMFRFLTVRRFVSTHCQGGTTRMFQHPVVPMWNETLFPVNPPSGFSDWIDPLGLGNQWDIVCTCGTCGGSGRVSCSGCSGSGQVTRTETYTEYSNGQSVSKTREYRETCNGCGGSGRVTCGNCSGYGRVVIKQTLNTQWQRLIPTHLAPHVQIPDFMDDAEERIFFRVPLVENRKEIPFSAAHDCLQPDLVARFSQGVKNLLGQFGDFEKTVEKHHDGKLYRADFQVTGFWTLRIGFRRLPGKVGWFFGARPEFHFPTLPLSWGAVGTVLFVIPFLGMTAIRGALWVQTYLQGVLPDLPK